MELFPPLAARVAHSSIGAALAAGGAAYAAQAEGRALAVALCVVLACLGLALRGYRVGVQCGPHQVTVRGLFRTRVIDRAAVTAVTDFPAIRWTGRSGRARWTPLTAFQAGPGELARITAAKRHQVARIRRWAARG
ncbi:hypothetical protein [Streptomyces sp. NPDC086023]|uniref:hypothetical protein n=1 Tax=Streptomyces sp. NPDC086023 TaxID=3365746 RepID=UPI0037D67438